MTEKWFQDAERLTVKTLIERLSTLDPNTMVVTLAHSGLSPLRRGDVAVIDGRLVINVKHIG